MSLTWLIIGILCVWRVTYLLNVENGPWDVLVRLRQVFQTGFSGRVLDCFSCLSVWVAAPFAAVLAVQWWESLLLWPALSAGAMLFERTTSFDDHTLPIVPAQHTRPTKRCCGNSRTPPHHDATSWQTSRPT